MKNIIMCVVFSVVSYLVGSLSFGVIYSRQKYKDDIRRHGSGNSGMTNTIRTYGKHAGAIVFLGDFLKGFLIVWLAGIVSHSPICQALAGFFVVMGHILPIFFGFKGGKGVATSGGVILAMNGYIFLILLLIFLAVVKKTKYVSLGSLIMCIMYPVLTIIFAVARLDFSVSSISKIILSVVLGIIVCYMHRTNIARLKNGTENKLGQKAE